MRYASLVLALATPLWAAYPTPTEAGFHHCALIYNRAQRPAEDLALYAAHHVAGRPTEWMFDAFLFLVFSTPSGKSTMTGATNQADWQAHLDQWFAPGRDLAALDEAIERCAKTLGQPPAKRAVMFSIPHPSRVMTQFGDVDGDGRSEDLSKPEDVKKVLSWYVGGVRQRFEAGHYKHLRLWGLYWMDEGIGEYDRANVKATSEVLHGQGLRFLWIPWYRAPGYTDWRELGFDVSIMQPNYAFQEVHLGKVRRNRLAHNAELSRDSGQGVEIELPMAYTAPAADRLFLHYLHDGSAGRWGYQDGATAYYTGAEDVEKLARTDEPRLRRLYDALADYIAGRPVPEPDAPTTWTTDGRALSSLDLGGLAKGERLTTAETSFDIPRAVSELDVFLDEPAGQPSWRGYVRVELRRPGRTEWEPGGWAVRPHPDQRTGRYQVVTVPVQQLASGLRVRFVSEAAAAPLVTGLAPFVRGPVDPLPNLALRRPYQFRPLPQGRYGDNGHKLNDGKVSQLGFASGEMVGWYGDEVAVTFDLGAVHAISQVVAHCQGGSVAAVNWPAGAVLFTGVGAMPPSSLGGPGAPPEGFTWLGPAPLQVDRERSKIDQDGHLTFQPAQPLDARYLTLVMKADGWLMLSEIEILSGGRNLAPQARYLLSPLPTAGGDAKYPENGRRLTDGVIPDGFSGQQLTGWTDREPREVVIDLGSARPLHEVVVWSVRYHGAGIHDLGSVVVDLSADGQTWRPAGQAELTVRPKKDGPHGPLAYRSAAAGEARFVRVRVTGGKGWAMLSEIEVH